MAESKQTLSVRLPPGLIELVRLIAVRTERRTSEVVREAVEMLVRRDSEMLKTLGQKLQNWEER